MIEPWTTAIAAAVLARQTPLGLALLAVRVPARPARRAGVEPWQTATWTVQSAWRSTLATYGLGVCRGCLRDRTAAPLVPVMRWNRTAGASEL